MTWFSMSRNLLVAVFLCMVISFSGCTNPLDGSSGEVVNTGGGSGLAILEFGPEYEHIVSGDTIDFVLKVQNIGDRDISSFTADPYLLAWSGFSDSQSHETTMYKPDDELGRIGTIATVRWSDVTVPGGLTKTETFQAGVMVRYDYSTETTAKVYALTSDQYAGYMERGKTPPTVKDVKNTNGPIQVQVLMDDVFITDAEASSVPVTLKFTNVLAPNGYPQAEGSDDAREYAIDGVVVSYLGDSNLPSMIGTTDCTGARLRKGETGSCTISVPVPKVERELELWLKIETDYHYVVEAETALVVHPDLGNE